MRRFVIKMIATKKWSKYCSHMIKILQSHDQNIATSVMTSTLEVYLIMQKNSMIFYLAEGISQHVCIIQPRW